MTALARPLTGGQVHTSGGLPSLRGALHLSPGVPSHPVIIHSPRLCSLRKRILPPPGGAKTFCFSPSCRSASRMAGVPGSAEPPFPHWARKSRRWWPLVCRRGGGTAQEGSLSLQGSSEPPGNTAYPPAGASRPRACRRPPAFLRLSRCFSLEVICKAARRMWSGGPS